MLIMEHMYTTHTHLDKNKYNLILLKTTTRIMVWWCVTVTPATQKAEAGGSLAPKSSRPARET